MNRDDIKCLLIDWVSATFSLTLMKLLAIRLSQQAGKSLVIAMTALVFRLHVRA